MLSHEFLLRHKYHTVTVVGITMREQNVKFYEVINDTISELYISG